MPSGVVHQTRLVFRSEKLEVGYVFRSLLDSGDELSWTFSSAIVVTSKSRM